MPLTEHDKIDNLMGQEQCLDLQVDGDASYVTGGYPLVPSLAARGITKVVRVDISPTALTEYYLWDYANEKIIFANGAGVQATNGSDQSARKNIRVRVYGTKL